MVGQFPFHFSGGIVFNKIKWGFDIVRLFLRLHNKSSWNCVSRTDGSAMDGCDMRVCVLGIWLANIWIGKKNFGRGPCRHGHEYNSKL
jgi:hypothetical protein